MLSAILSHLAVYFGHPPANPGDLKGTLKLSVIRILVLILDKILLMILVALLLPELLELQVETLK